MRKIIKYRAGAAITKNTFVKLSSGKTAAQTSATAIDTIGVQLNTTAADGDIAYVCVEGPCEVTVGVSETLVAGELVRPGTSGNAYGADASTDILVGRYYGHEVNGTAETVAGGDLVTIHLFANKTMVKA
jgi:hypothetical protein